jgi:hypothetical protein
MTTKVYSRAALSQYHLRAFERANELVWNSHPAGSCKPVLTGTKVSPLHGSAKGPLSGSTFQRERLILKAFPRESLGLLPNNVPSRFFGSQTISPFW